MQKNSTGQRHTWAGYALIGIALFAVGGAVLEDAMGSDSLTFFGCACLACGLVGIIAGGVALGTSSRGDR